MKLMYCSVFYIFFDQNVIKRQPQLFDDISNPDILELKNNPINPDLVRMPIKYFENYYIEYMRRKIQLLMTILENYYGNITRIEDKEDEVYISLFIILYQNLLKELEDILRTSKNVIIEEDFFIRSILYATSVENNSNDDNYSSSYSSYTTNTTNTTNNTRSQSFIDTNGNREEYFSTSNIFNNNSTNTGENVISTIKSKKINKIERYDGINNNNEEEKEDGGEREGESGYESIESDYNDIYKFNNEFDMMYNENNDEKKNKNMSGLDFSNIYNTNEDDNDNNNTSSSRSKSTVSHSTTDSEVF